MSEIPAQNSLAGKRVLIVEDEYFIAADLAKYFRAEGAEVVGPAGNLASGMKLANEQSLDAAVLDVNLEGTRSFPIADRLSAGAVPFMFLTGYDNWALPDTYQSIPRVAKPFPPQTVIDTVARLLSPEAST